MADREGIKVTISVPGGYRAKVLRNGADEVLILPGETKELFWRPYESNNYSIFETDLEPPAEEPVPALEETQTLPVGKVRADPKPMPARPVLDDDGMIVEEKAKPADPVD